MKKLRMIVTSVIVLAIVGSAFAFNAKKLAAFCIDNTGDSQCDIVITGRFIDAAGTTIKYYNGWDGLTSTCTATGSNCPSTSTVKVKNNNS